MNIALTDKAVTKIKEIFTQDQALAGKNLRVYIEKGGCSGFSYGFKFDDAAANDKKKEFEGFNLIIDEESEKMLAGATIDYKEDFGAEGFSIQNPNAEKSCGCGNSFEA